MRVYKSWHQGCRVLIFEFPLAFGSIEEVVRMCLTYRKAITFEQPYWNGCDWMEWDSRVDDLPF